MKRGQKPIAPLPLPLAAPAVPSAPAVISTREPWYRSVFTDRNHEFDTGRVLVAVVIIGMCWMQWYDVSENGNPFNAQTFGIGIGSVLTGFALYLFGDAQRPPAPAPSTITKVEQTQVTRP